MIKRKRLLCLVLAAVLSFGSVLTVHADEISDAKKKQEELEGQKQEAEAQKDSLKATLNTVISDMEKAQADLDAKQIEITETQDQLDIAKINEFEQYESMKMRIKYMYENGNTEFIEILCAAKDIGDFLNKAEYIQQISEYDRNMLEEFKSIVKQVEEKEARLKEEEKKLADLQQSLIEKQDQVESLLAETNLEISSLEEQIGDNAAKLQSLIKEAEEAKRRQEEIRKAQEAANNANKPNRPSGGSGSGKPGGSQIIGSGRLAWPCASQRVTSYFGWREIPVAGATAYHDAIDIGASIGTAVYAADSGKVITASFGYNGGRGNYIMVDHGNGMRTRYQHLNDIYVSVGQTVSRGQNIAAVGNTGASSGPHLDFAVYVGGSTVNPLDYL